MPSVWVLDHSEPGRFQETLQRNPNRTVRGADTSAASRGRPSCYWAATSRAT